jgi:hypothetical protein
LLKAWLPATYSNSYPNLTRHLVCQPMKR